MNRFINKAIAICKVFFNVSNSVERLPNVCKEYSHGGIHIHEYKWEFNKHINKNIYKRQSGRNLTNEEYITYIEGLDFSNIVQIKVRYK